MVVLDELADAGDRDQDARVEKSFELRADRYELAARYAKQRRRPGVGQNTLLAQVEDRGFDFGVDGRKSSAREMAERAGFEPAVGLLALRRFSKPLVSAAHPPLR